MSNSRGSKQPIFVAAWIGMAILISQPGCQVFQRFQKPVPKAPVAFEATPTLETLIAQLNRQSAAVKQVNTEVTVSMDGIPGRLRGTLMVERPKKLRLKAGLLGVAQMGVDVGSNDELFWIWSRANIPGQPPALYYANHQRYESSELRNNLPLEPTWLIDALGFVEFSPTDRHEGPFPRSDGRIEIITYHQSAGKSNIRKSVIDPKYGWIDQQSMYDRNGRLLAYVNSIEHQYYPDSNISLPQKIDIHVRQPDGQELKLSVDAENYSINSINGDPSRLWTMPNPQDVMKVDLTQVSNPQFPTNSNSAITPSAGQVRPYDRFQTRIAERND